MSEKQPVNSRGTNLQVQNRFQRLEVVREDENLPTEERPQRETQIFRDRPKKIVNRVDSPDLALMHSLNPYQGCEHGCSYCYARNSHQYWGYSAGLDFESRLIVKENAPELLRQHLDNPRWQPQAISLSGNTDCYQPIERKFRLTRQLLEVFLEYRHPVGIITKNRLILRDLVLLQELAKMQLVKVMISITTLDEEIRRRMEPRTATAKQRLHVVEELHKHGIPVGVMVAPIVPGLTDSEVPAILQEAGVRGAQYAGYTILRLNGHLPEIFGQWLQEHFPDRAQKVLNQTAACHGGTVNDTTFGRRIKGSGQEASMIHQLFQLSRRRFLPQNVHHSYNTSFFRRVRGQLDLFQ